MSYCCIWSFMSISISSPWSCGNICLDFCRERGSTCAFPSTTSRVDFWEYVHRIYSNKNPVHRDSNSLPRDPAEPPGRLLFQGTPNFLSPYPMHSSSNKTSKKERTVKPGTGRGPYLLHSRSLCMVDIWVQTASCLKGERRLT